jgi:hypothetical protein
MEDGELREDSKEASSGIVSSFVSKPVEVVEAPVHFPLLSAAVRPAGATLTSPPPPSTPAPAVKEEASFGTAITSVSEPPPLPLPHAEAPGTVRVSPP